jgi:hypothetical protein
MLPTLRFVSFNECAVIGFKLVVALLVFAGPLCSSQLDFTDFAERSEKSFKLSRFVTSRFASDLMNSKPLPLRI